MAAPSEKVVVTAVLPWTADGAAAPFSRSVQQAPGHPRDSAQVGSAGRLRL